MVALGDLAAPTVDPDPAAWSKPREVRGAPRGGSAGWENGPRPTG